jgi:hypothetical protein
MEYKILTCGICNGKDIKIEYQDNQFEFYCGTCDNSGGCSDSILGAAIEWNKTVKRHEIKIDIPAEIELHNIQCDDILNNFCNDDFKESNI